MSHPSKLNSHGGLAFILGAIAVIAAIGVYFLVAQNGDVSVSIEGEDTVIEKAAEAVSDG